LSISAEEPREMSAATCVKIVFSSPGPGLLYSLATGRPVSVRELLRASERRRIGRGLQRAVRVVGVAHVDDECGHPEDDDEEEQDEHEHLTSLRPPAGVTVERALGANFSHVDTSCSA
jgi:hypothetical protein